jgi:hypothetical protein
MSVGLYQRVADALDKTPFAGRIMPYDWGGLPKSLYLTWMAYSGMFDDFAREIANTINQLTNNVHRLSAWDVVLHSSGNDEKLRAVREFIDPLATVSLNLPYVIRSQFIFSTAHLCNQANQTHDGASWKDDLPLDEEIYFSAADKYGANWLAYKPLKALLERIGDKGYRAGTSDYRNAYNHRFSPRVVIGITKTITRQIDPSGQVSYSFGGSPPLPLKLVVDQLTAQCGHCYSAFEAFQTLIGEHEVFISKENQAALARVAAGQS